MSTDQITPALCRELGMVEDSLDRWIWETDDSGLVFHRVVYTPAREGGNTPESLRRNAYDVEPTASNLRSIISQLTPHEEWLRGRLRALDHNQRLQVAMLMCWSEGARLFIQNESIDQAAAIIAGGEDG